MTVTDSSIIDALKKKGHRITIARKAVIALVTNSKNPLSALEVHALLRKEQMDVSNVTVYRELAFLEDEGFLHGVSLKDGVKRYCRSSEGHHHHLVCTGCNTVEDVHMEPDLQVIEKKIRQEKSFNVQSHSLEFYGLCPKCA